MIDEYLSEDEEILTDSDSDDEYLSFNNDQQATRSTSGEFQPQFELQIKNKHIETLRALRSCLRDNKALRKRLVIVEGELEKYEGFRAPNILPLRDQSTSTFELPTNLHLSTPNPSDQLVSPPKSPEDTNNKSPEPKTTHKSVQVNFVQRQPSPEIRIIKEVVREEVIKEVYVDKTESSVRLAEKRDESCQTIDDLSDKIRIADLTRQVDALSRKFENERDEMSRKLSDYEKKINELNTDLSESNRLGQLTDEKLTEANKTILKLTDESQKMDIVRNSEMMLRVENGQLVREVAERQRLLDDAGVKFEELAENHRKALEIVESQKREIGRLVEEVESHSRGMASKLEVLEVELGETRGNLEAQLGENRRLNELVNELNKHIERYKQDLKNFNFKEFVAMKRELNSLRQEKERQFVNAAAAAATGTSTGAVVGTPPPLPPIKPLKNNIFNFFK